MTVRIERPFRTIGPIFQGSGISQETGKRLADAGLKKALVIYDKGIEATGIGPKIAQTIKDAGLVVVESNLVQADPPDTSVNMIAEIGRREEVDCIVAVGGGSTIDTAKGVNVLLTNPGEIGIYFDRTIPQKPGKYLVAIPTTAGTGSESTGGGIVTNTEVQVKGVIAGAATVANLILVDPDLTLGVPPYVTATTGFDVLAHAIDGMLSIFANDITKSIASETIRLFNANIEEVVTNGKNVEARNNMLTAASLGGLIITGANCSLSHSFGHSIGATHHIAHGNCVGRFLPPTIDYVAEQKPKEIMMIADAFRLDYNPEGDINEISRQIGEHITDLANRMGLKTMLDIEPEVDKLDVLIPMAKADVMTTSTPRPLTDEGAKWIIERAYSY